MFDSFAAACDELFQSLGDHGFMVLSTCSNGNVSSRMVSVVILDGLFYFQTDCTMKKYQQLMDNPAVALCTDNVQIEGVCRDIGQPLEHQAFVERYDHCFHKSFLNYSGLHDERLLAVTPTFIQKWVYENGVPYVERFFFTTQEYTKTEYIGN